MSGGVRLAVALETSARPASIAVSNARGNLIAKTLDGDRSHASDLLVELDAATKELGGDRRELDLVVVGTGPGSYTGLRVGAATALGLHRGAGAQLIGVPSLEATAWSGLRQGETGTVVRNAFGGQVYIATYRHTGAAVEVVREPACVTPQAALGALAADSPGTPAILLADHEAMGALGVTSGELDADVREDVRTDAEALMTLGLARHARGGAAAGGVASIQPLYLRPFEAKVRRR